MSSLLRFGLALFLLNIVSNCCVTAVVSSGVSRSTSSDSIVDTHDKLLKVQIELIGINATQSLVEIKDRLSALEAEFKKLNELSDLRRTYANESCDVAIAMKILTNHYSSIDSQLKSLQIGIKERVQVEEQNEAIKDIVNDIKSGNFTFANDKLNQLGSMTLIPKIVNKVYSEENVDILMNWAKSLWKITPTYEVLKSLYEEMKENNHQDPHTLIVLAETLESQVIEQQNNPNKINTNANAFIDELLDIIRRTATEFLVKAMNKACDYKTRVDVHTLAGALYVFRPEVSDHVMEALVDRTYGSVVADVILDNICSHSITAQAISGVNALFWKLKNDGEVNSVAVLNLASNLSKLREKSEFATLDEKRKSAVNKVVEGIPTCARNLFFNSSSICLWNKARDTYLIAADSSLNHDTERRNIFTYSPSNSSKSSVLEDVPTGAAWIPEKVNDKILFRSVDYPSEYLYVAAFEYNAKMRYVFNWIKGDNKDDQSAFNVELDGDHCYLRSTYFNEYLFASDVEYKNDESYSYSYVFTWKSDTSHKNSDFVWQIRSC